MVQDELTKRTGYSPQQVNYAVGRLVAVKVSCLQGSLNLLVEEVIKAWHIDLLCNG